MVTKPSLDLGFIGVVKDVETVKTIFKKTLGINSFGETRTTRLKEYDGTYSGNPSDSENLVPMAFSGEYSWNSFSPFQVIALIRTF